MKNLIISIILLVIFAAVLCGQEVLEPSIPDFIIEAKAKLDSFAFNDCIDVVTKALEKPGSEDLLSTDEKIEGLILRAVAHFNLNQIESTRQDLRSVLEMNPAYELDSPYIGQLMNDLWQEVVNKTVGELAITVSPANAEVFVDDKEIELAEGPVFLLLAGEREVLIRAPDYASWQQEVTIAAGEAGTLNVELQRVTASLRLQTKPAGVQIYVNGELKGTTIAAEEGSEDGLCGIFEIHELQLGEYEVTLKKDCYKTEISNVGIIRLGQFVITEPFELQRQTAKLQLPDLPPMTQLTVNGETVNRGADEEVVICPGSELVIEARSLFGSGRLVVENIVADQAYGSDLRLQPTVVTTPPYDIDERKFNILQDPPDYNFSTVLNGSEGDHLKLRLGALIDTIVQADIQRRTVKLSGDQFRVAQDLLTYHGAFFLEIPLIRGGDAVAILYLNALYPFAETGQMKSINWSDITIEWTMAGWSGLKVMQFPISEEIRVVSVYPDSPAAKAGLKKGMLITAVHVEDIDTVLAINRTGAIPPGEAVRLTVVENDEEKEISFSTDILPLFNMSSAMETAPYTIKLARLLLESELDRNKQLYNAIQYRIGLLLRETRLLELANKNLARLTANITKTGQYAEYIAWQRVAILGAMGKEDIAKRLRDDILANESAQVYNGAQDLPLSFILKLTENTAEVDGNEIK